MKMPILSVRDSLVGFGTTFTSVNENVAVRGFTNSIIAMLGGDGDATTSPEDLALYLIGEFDSDDGTISPCEPRALVYGRTLAMQHSSNTCNSSSDTGGVIDGNN